jgi:hypothetical protein
MNRRKAGGFRLSLGEANSAELPGDFAKNGERGQTQVENRCAARALARAATSSRFLGGALDSSD